MTFYWWSHWFWITLLGNILLTITFVQTYPSQEISLEYNQNSKTVKTVTKLYQTTTTLTWATATATPPNSNFIGVTADKTILQSVTPEMIKDDNDHDNVADEDEAADELLIQTDEEQEIEEDIDDVSSKADQVDVEDGDDESDEELEFKRSADNFNKTDGINTKNEKRINENEESGKKSEGLNEENQEAADEQDSVAGSAKLKREENNNYTNFSKTENSVSTNSTNNNNTSPLTSPADADASKATASLSAVPAAPRIAGSTTHSVPDWFNALAQLPPTDTEDNVDSESVTVAHKIPFTLENVNKEEELRRAENEHRSRKSKVLSADYKHINRFINFSADSKSLLTRSASSAPNEFEGDEGNISSEALAIQRTYFLDAGAISAICFTIFGVCCTVGTIGIVLYRRRYVNKPQTLSEPDSSVYIDDSTMRDNSDEMYSLDNDSFLNSLEAMTIQNYWTDTVKHTKL